jgi:hypothetical protein
MVEKIEQQIVLTGAEQVEAQLNKIGAAGEQAFRKIDQAAKQAGSGSGLKQIDKGASDASKSLSDLATAAQRMPGPLGSVVSIVSELGTSLGTIGTAATVFVGAVGGIGIALTKLAESAANTTTALRDAAIASGITIEEFQKFAFAAEQSGSSAEAMQRAFAIIADEADKAREAGTRSSGAFQRLGIDLLNASGNTRNFGDVLGDLADKIKGAKDPSDQLTIAISALTRRVGPQLLQTLRDGRQGFAEFAATLDALGGPITTAEAELGENLSDALDRTGKAFELLRTRIGLAFAPAVIEGADALTKVIAGLGEVLIPLADVIGGALLSGLKELVNVGTNIKGIVTDIVSIGQKLGDLANQLPIVRQLVGAFRDLSSVFKDIVSVIPGVGSFVQALDTAKLSLVQALDTAKLSLDKLNQQLGTTGDAARNGLNAAGQAVDELGRKVENTRQNFLTMDSAIDAVGNKDKTISVLDDAFRRVDTSAQQAAQGGISSVATELAGAGESAAQAGSGISQLFTTLDQAAVNFSNQITTAIGKVTGIDLTPFFQKWQQTFDQIVSSASTSGTDIVNALVTAISSADFSSISGVITGAFQEAVNELSNVDFSGAVSGLVTSLQTALAQIPQIAQNTFGQLPAILQNIVAQLPARFQQVAETIGQAFNTAVNLARTAFSALGTVAQTAGSTIAAAMTAAKSDVDSLKQAADNAAAAFSNMAEAARAAASAAAAAAGAGAGHARGGPVYGPGSSTSDSIPARLSAGEWVIRAAAVRKYGHALFYLLNSMRLDPRRLQSIFTRGFAHGGLVSPQAIKPVAVPLRMAGGGPVPALAPVTLNIGGQSLTGLLAPRDVAEKLTRFSMSENIKSAGRKPTWFF